MAGGRRRTDGQDAGRPPAGEAVLSDHPTTPGRRRAARREGLPDVGGRTSRPSDPPAPVSRRPPVPPIPPRRAAPRTAVVPIPVPSPEARPDKYSPERLAETPLPGSPPPGLPLRPEPKPAGRSAEPVSARTPPPSLPEGHPSAPVPDRTPARPAAARPTPARPTVARPAPPPATERRVVPAPAPAPEPAAARATPWSTGPTGTRAAQPRPASAALAAGLRAGALPGSPTTHPSGPVYGDWTRPSRSGADSGSRAAGPETQEDRLPVAPATTAVPEREAARGRRGPALVDDDEDRYGDRNDDHDRPARARSAGVVPDPRAPLTDPGTGPSTQVRGGRAKDRAARQVVDAERRKELKRRGEDLSARAYLDGDDLDGKRSPRGKILALVAVVVVALGVLGVYSFVSPETRDASSNGTATRSAPAPSPSDVADASLPELSISPPPVVENPPVDVKAPVIVLNATDVNGLAGRIADTLKGGGWETPATSGYTGGDVSVTTVYFTDGDETQQQAAQSLINQFPQIHGPVPRFFDVPDQPAPGLVVIATGDWQP